MGHLSRALTRQGIAVLRFDFTGLGESEGDFAETNFSSNVEDLVEMAALLAREREAPRILVGHSLGGAAVIRAAARIESVRAVATVGAPHDPWHVAHLFSKSLDEIEQRGEARVTLAGRPFTIRRQLLDDLAGAGLDQALGELGRALLVFHSPVDRVVGIENAARIFQAARHPKSFVSLDRADHLLSDEADAVYAGSVLGPERRRWPLERVEVRLRHRKDHADDCAGCERPGAVGIDDEQRRRLVEIAGRCPVHRTLTAGALKVDTRLGGEARRSG